MRPEAGRKPRLRGLYAITPETADTAALARGVRLALEGGAAIVQYRAKALGAGVALEQARALRALCSRHGALFIVNDAVDLAAASLADGVHLGRDDDSVADARRLLPGAIVGVSCYAEPQRAREAAAAGADYVAIGSVFASATKPHAVRAPLTAIAEARAASGLPVVAIGGITALNAAEAVSAGADMVAIISALFEADDIRGTARAVAALFPILPETSHVRTQP